MQQKISHYEKKMKDLKNELDKIASEKVVKIGKQAQTEGDFIISEKEHQKIINKFNQEIKNQVLSLENFEK